SGKEGITRLILGGVHGNEGRVSEKILKKIEPNPSEGKVIIIPNLNISRRGYISTLDKDYVSSPTGRMHRSILERYRPDVVVELHAFNFKGYKSLIDKDRMNKKGVPTMVPYREDLPMEDQVLHGGPPPWIKDRFKEHASYITLEVHEDYGKEAEKTLLFILNAVMSSKSVKEIRDRLKGEYQASMKKAGSLLQDYLSRSN
ncbi:MAG: DUF2119 family protein, partial [Nitrososphaerales archaeon]